MAGLILLSEQGIRK